MSKPREFWVIGNEIYSCQQVGFPVPLHTEQIHVREVTPQDEMKDRLLKKARKVLENYWFLSTDEDEYNNDDVIEISREIDAFYSDPEGS